MKTDVDTCLKEIADWYVKHRREITEPELEAILLKHCEDEAEVKKFTEFLATAPGQLRFKTLLRERKETGASYTEEHKSEQPTSEERKFAEGMWESTRQLVEGKDPYGTHIWRILEHYYPGDRERQVSVLGHMNEIYGKYGKGPIPQEELLKSAHKWGVERMVAIEMMYHLEPESPDTIFFNVPEAREQLIREGYVYTLRPRMRKTGWDVAYYGSYYKKEKIGDVWVSFVKEIKDMEELKPYFYASGFKKLTDWWEAAKGSRFLFRVSFKR